MAYASHRFGASQAALPPCRCVPGCRHCWPPARRTALHSQTGSLNAETNVRPGPAHGEDRAAGAAVRPGPTGCDRQEPQAGGGLALFERDNPNLQLIVKDDKGTPDGARTAAEDALKSGATLILGPVFASRSPRSHPWHARLASPVIAFSNDRQVAGNGVYLLSFQPAPEVERVVAYAASQGKRRYAALISQDAFGKIVAAGFRDAVSRNTAPLSRLRPITGSANAMLEPLRKISAAIVGGRRRRRACRRALRPGRTRESGGFRTAAAPAEINTQQGQADRHRRHGLSECRARLELRRRLVPRHPIRGLDRFFPEVRQELRPRHRRALRAWPTMPWPWPSHSQVAAMDSASRRRPLPARHGFTGIDGGYRLLADGTADRSLAIL